MDAGRNRAAFDGSFQGIGARIRAGERNLLLSTAEQVENRQRLVETALMDMKEMIAGSFHNAGMAVHSPLLKKVRHVEIIVIKGKAILPFDLLLIVRQKALLHLIAHFNIVRYFHFFCPPLFVEHLFQLVHERVDVLELAVNRRKTDVRHLIQVF